MLSIFGWVAGALLCGVGALVFLTLAIVNKRMGQFWLAGVLFLITAGCVVMAVYRFGTKVRAHVEETFRPRTGMEIYTALFPGTPELCVEVTAKQDQIMPRLDAGVSLRMRTCPAEVARILAGGEYTMERIATGADTAGVDPDLPFAVEQLGDTMLAFQWEVVPGRRWRSIHVSLDSTVAICEDVAD